MKLTKKTLRLLIEEEVKNILDPRLVQEYYDEPLYQQKTEIQQISKGDIWFYDPRPKQDTMIQSPVEAIRINIVDPYAAKRMGLPGMIDGIVGLSLPTNLVAQPSDTVFFYDQPEMDKLATALSKAANSQKALVSLTNRCNRRQKLLWHPKR